jgi:hypothetical protein
MTTNAPTSSSEVDHSFEEVKKMFVMCCSSDIPPGALEDRNGKLIHQNNFTMHGFAQLVLFWAQKEWENHANFNTKLYPHWVIAPNLTSALHAYFSNPDYSWPEKDEFGEWKNMTSEFSWQIYNYVTGKFPKATQVLGVNEIIPKIQTQVGWLQQKWTSGNWNPWVRVRVDTETLGSRPK